MISRWGLTVKPGDSKSLIQLKLQKAKANTLKPINHPAKGSIGASEVILHPHHPNILDLLKIIKDLPFSAFAVQLQEVY